MLKALEQPIQIKRVFLSLEERMGCGIGACFACVCQTGDDPTGFHIKKYAVTVLYFVQGRW